MPRLTDASLQVIIDQVQRRRKPIEKYSQEQIDLVKKAYECLKGGGKNVNVKRLHQQMVNIGIAYFGFHDFVYEYYADIGNIEDVKWIASNLGLKLGEEDEERAKNS